MASRRAALETRLGHRFGRPELLEQALTHASYGADNNERLEFIGDGVLGCAIAEELFRRFPRLPEGRLTQLRSALVRQEALARLGEGLGLAAELRVGANLRLSPAVLADALEAVLGAVFVDGGYEAARVAVIGVFGELLEGLDPDTVAKDAKSELQELLHARGLKAPEYRTLRSRGPDNSPTFDVSCTVAELGLETQGTGGSLQRAQQQAALAMLGRVAR